MLQSRRAARLNRFVAQKSLDLFRDGLSRGIAPGRFLFETFQANRLEIAIYFWIVEPRLSRVRFQNHAHRFVGCVPDERRMPSEQLVKDCAKPINICRSGELRVVTGGLLWRHVAG